jgi:arylformamidase
MNNTLGGINMWIDITMPLHKNMPIWPGDTPFNYQLMATLEQDGANVGEITMSVHAGTHIDSPFHFVEDGATVEKLPVELFIGPARVCALDVASQISASDVARLELAGEKRVLFKTRNSSLLHKREYDPTFVAFSVDGAKALADLGVQLVGLDYLSVAHADDQVPVHRAFLDRGMALLEGIDLSQVTPGRYELICLPIKLAASDGALCRAVLREL